MVLHTNAVLQMLCLNSGGRQDHSQSHLCEVGELGRSQVGHGAIEYVTIARVIGHERLGLAAPATNGHLAIAPRAEIIKTTLLDEEALTGAQL
jgi:hypothetical protein